jgi:hypothetical protein
MLAHARGGRSSSGAFFDAEIRVAGGWERLLLRTMREKKGRDAEALRKEFLRFFLVFSHKKCPNPNKTGKNRKKPVETEEL